MKKFMKVCAITVAVILALGVLLLTIGGCGGGFKRVTQQIWNGELNISPGNVTEWFGNWAWDEDWETYDIDANTLFDSSYDVIRNEGSFRTVFGVEEIRSMELELAGCVVQIETSPDEFYYVSAEKISAFQTFVRNGTLYVKGIKTGKWNKGSVMRVTIQIPEGTVFEDAELSLGAGEFTIGSMNANDMEINLGAGKLTADYLKADKFTCTAGAGQILIDKAEFADDVEISVGAGEVIMTASIPGDLHAECGLGNMEITIFGSTEQEHNYKMECAAGNLTAGSRSVSGLAAEQDIDNGAASDFDLECAMGNLSVRFQ